MAKQTITRTIDLALARDYVNALQVMIDKIHEEDPMGLDFEMWIGPEVRRVQEEYANWPRRTRCRGQVKTKLFDLPPNLLI